MSPRAPWSRPSGVKHQAQTPGPPHRTPPFRPNIHDGDVTGAFWRHQASRLRRTVSRGQWESINTRSHGNSWPGPSAQKKSIADEGGSGGRYAGVAYLLIYLCVGVNWGAGDVDTQPYTGSPPMGVRGINYERRGLLSLIATFARICVKFHLPCHFSSVGSFAIIFEIPLFLDTTLSWSSYHHDSWRVSKGFNDSYQILMVSTEFCRILKLNHLFSQKSSYHGVLNNQICNLERRGAYRWLGEWERIKFIKIRIYKHHLVSLYPWLLEIIIKIYTVLIRKLTRPEYNF